MTMLRRPHQSLPRAALALFLLSLAGPAVINAQAQPCGGVVDFSIPTPSNLQAVVAGTAVTLSWNLPPGTAALLCVYGASSGAVFEGMVGSVSTVSGAVPPGDYVVRLHAVTAKGQSPSATQSFTVAAAIVPPGAPGNPTFTRSGFQVELSWAAPTTGGPVVDYVLEAGTSSGATNVGVFPTPASRFSGTAAPGVYYVRVRARNSAGTGPPSPELVLDLTAATPSGSLRPCSEAVVSRSGPSTSVTVVNNSALGILLHWIDWFGTPMIMDAVSVGQTKVMSSYVGASYFVTDVFNRCYGTFVVTPNARITVP